MLDNAELSYYHTNLQDHSRDSKQIFRLCNGLLGRNKDLQLPQILRPRPCRPLQQILHLKIEKKICIALIKGNSKSTSLGATPPKEISNRPTNITLECF